MQALRPTLFIGVPRVFDKVYAGVEERLAGAGVVSRLIFRLAVFFKQRALRRGLRWDEVCGLQRLPLRTSGCLKLKGVQGFNTLIVIRMPVRPTEP